MAFAIASGVTPQAGIFTAIIAGFLISALGGSRVQIGGPTGAYIVIVYGIVVQYGVANLIVCTIAAGVLLLAMGAHAPGRPHPLHPGVDRHRLHQRHRGADPAVADEGLPRARHHDARRILHAHDARSPPTSRTVDPVTVAVSRRSASPCCWLWPKAITTEGQALERESDASRADRPAAATATSRCATARWPTPCAAARAA